MPNIENFVVNTFRAPRPADVDRDKYSNALLRNEAQRIPQANQAQDLGLKAADQAINQRGTDHKRKILSDMFSAIADNPSMAATIVRTPLFQQIGREVGLPIEQFDPQPGDDLNEISQKSRGWAQWAGANYGATGADEFGLTPQFGTDAQGNPVMLQTSKQGRAVQTQMPPGVSLSREPIRLDAGTHYVLLDPITRQPVGTIPKDLKGQAQAAGEQARITALEGGRGKTQAEAEAAAPGVAESKEQLASVAQSLLDNPNTASVFGTIRGRTPTLLQPTIDAEADVDRLIALLSLENRAKLKGSGAISDFESKTLGQAATVLQDKRISPERAKKELQTIAEILGSVQQGLPPVIPGSSGGQPGTPPRVGEVVDGYRYKGGNPALESSWELQ